jgi:hypothetical protein
MTLDDIQAPPDSKIRKRARGSSAEPRCEVCDNTGMPIEGVNGGQRSHLRGCPACGKKQPWKEADIYRKAFGKAAKVETVTRRRKR